MRGLAGERPCWLAEDAVLIETVCAGEFPSQREITGIRSENSRTGVRSRDGPEEIPSAYGQIPVRVQTGNRIRLNREFWVGVIGYLNCNCRFTISGTCLMELPAFGDRTPVITGCEFLHA
jgi:hypothetical protein